MGSEEISVARLHRGDKKFEVIVDPFKAYEFKLGKRTDPSEVIKYEEVFLDARKGRKASEEDLREAFGTTNFLDIVEEIVKKGSVQLTEKQRKELVEAKRKRVIDIISRTYVDPRTGHPHPPVRVELALKDAKVKIDPFKSAKEQIKQVVDQLRTVLPLKMEKVNLRLQIPASFVGRSYGVLKGYGEITSEKWLADGSLLTTVSVNSALKDEFIAEISRRTSGNARVTIIEK